MSFQSVRIFLGLLCVFVTTPIHAQVVTIPADLSPGDEYRLAFVTKNLTPALSSDIADYDAFVTAQANDIAALEDLATGWRVIGSTPSVSAIFHTETDNSPPGLNGVPIYRLDGAIIVANYDALWGGFLENPIQIAQDGSLVTTWGSWTGTRADGVAIPGDELGAADLTVVDGAPFGSGPNWVETGAFGAENPQRLYAISDVLIAPNPTINIAIDIKPGSDTNCFNANGHGVIPVAVLGTDAFDVSNIDQTTLSFGGSTVRVRGNRGPFCGLEDANGDGFDDIVCQFEDNPDYWEPGQDDATLTGALLDGTSIEGTDTICIVP